LVVVAAHNQQEVQLEVQVQLQVLHSKEVMHLAHSIQAAAVVDTGAEAADITLAVLPRAAEVVEAPMQAA
jgi:hypothetical protein